MTKIVKHYRVKEAKDFFERLAAYSADYVRCLLPSLHKTWPTRNSYDKWRNGRPVGHVLHYTAGTNFAGTIRHFVRGGRSSSHWVVSKAVDRRADGIREQFDLQNDLRSECVQVVIPDRPAWHAGWVNRLCVGTEVRNAGILRPYPKDPPRGMPKKPQRGVTRDDLFRFADVDVDDLDFYWWPDGWTTPFNGEVLKVRGSWWESWSRGSVATAIVVLRYLNSIHELDPSYFLAHHCTNCNKNDVVLPLPLDKFRDAVLYDDRHVDDIDWLAEFDDSEDGFEDLDDPWMLREISERQHDRAEEDLEDFDTDDTDGFVTTPVEVSEALKRLGYYVPDGDETRLHVAVRIYQRSRGLVVDGAAGPVTKARISKDLASWRISEGV